MFAIFEGGDGVGKSTLAEAVAERIQELHPDDKVEMLHRSQLKRPPTHEYAFDVDDYRPGTGRHLVCDRWHVGEMVYGPLYRDAGEYGAMGEASFRWIDLYLRTRGANLWLVDHPNQKVRERLAIRGEDYLLPKDLDWCLDRFRDVTPRSGAYRGRIDTSLEPMDKILDGVMRHLTWSDNDLSRFAPFPGYVGASRIMYLLVGEKHGGQPPHMSESAFIPTGANSSVFLLEALPERMWKDVGLVNAYETDVRELLMTFDVKPSVVALGRAASANLAALDIDHGVVPHPQYVRRFANSKKSEYGELIKHVAHTEEQRFSWK